MHNPVILSGAKDPLPGRSVICSARSFYSALAVRTGNWQLRTGN